MTSSPYLVSLHPGIALDENLSLFADLNDPRIQRLLIHAMGVLLPTYITPQRYFRITQMARAWFPRLEVRFQYLGKTKQIQLFRELGIRHPESLVFNDPGQLLEYCVRHGSPWGFPAVIKGDLGGGGVGVFPVYSVADVDRQARRLPADQPALLQRWVNHQGKDLRVVVYGELAVSYFRLGADGFYNNICRGGRIDHDLSPEQQQRGIAAVQALCGRVGVDIAGFDLMFPDQGEPVFVEINHHFGRKGLGGTAGHQRYFLKAVWHWRQRLMESHPELVGCSKILEAAKVDTDHPLSQQGC